MALDWGLEMRLAITRSTWKEIGTALEAVKGRTVERHVNLLA